MKGLTALEVHIRMTVRLSHVGPSWVITFGVPVSDSDVLSHGSDAGSSFLVLRLAQ